MNVTSLRAWSDAFPALSAVERCTLLLVGMDADMTLSVVVRRADLAARVGVSEPTVTRALAALIAAGALSRSHRVGGNGTTYAIIGMPTEDAAPAAIQPMGDASPVEQIASLAPPPPSSEPNIRHRVAHDPLFSSLEKIPIEVSPKPRTTDHPRSIAPSRVEYSYFLSTPYLSSLVPPVFFYEKNVTPKTLKNPNEPALRPPSLNTPQPQPAITGPTDLLGGLIPDDPDALVGKAVEYWIKWQASAGRKKHLAITPRRRQMFLGAWRLTLNRNWTQWQIVCRRCVRNQVLIGAVGGRSNWGGATFDWLFWKDNLARVLDGTEFPENYKQAVVPGAA